ncbi:MAG: glutathione S-transferase N-terminal domain-containing protein [Litorimonas sp.]
MSDTPYYLYGMSASLFTGKVRAYLIHHGIPFVERGAGHPTFTQEIVPKIGRWIIPVLVTPDGQIIQDGTDIIDHLDAKGLSRHPLCPEDPVLHAVAHLFELFGGEGLLRPAMHYRWNFDTDNLDFIQINFAEAFPPGLTVQQQSAMFDHSSGRMRKAGAAFGVSSETMTAIEASYAEFLSLFEDHLRESYFLLGEHPTLGDYGLMNGLYAHLSRDPHPSLIMKRDAPHVFAWTERMNRLPRDEHHLAGAPEGLFDEVPDTLKALMQFIAADFLPEVIAHTQFINSWLAEHEDLPNDPMERSLGMATFDWRGHAITTAVMPYRNWMIQRLTDHYDGCDADDRYQIRTLFASVGLVPILETRIHRRVMREGNRELWEEETS